MQAGSSIEKRLRHVPNFFQLLGGRDVARTHTHTHTLTHIYIRTYTDFKTRSYEKDSIGMTVCAPMLQSQELRLHAGPMAHTET